MLNYVINWNYCERACKVRERIVEEFVSIKTYKKVKILIVATGEAAHWFWILVFSWLVVAHPFKHQHWGGGSKQISCEFEDSLVCRGLFHDRLQNCREPQSQKWKNKKNIGFLSRGPGLGPNTPSSSPLCYPSPKGSEARLCPSGALGTGMVHRQNTKHINWSKMK